MKTTRSLTALLSFALLTGLASGQYYQGPPPPPQGYAQQPWEAPPAQFAAAWQRGYHDGVEGARKDYDNHRPPNVNNRDEYRNPKFMRPPDRHDYRAGFREGYRVAVQHIYGRGGY
jgi:hypothetical protein